jgi:copper chaperone CopZ
MKKKYRLENLGCAHCAEKMCDGILKIDGVETCNISFIAQKMTITADEDKFDNVMEKARRIISRIEPDCKIVE